MATTTTPDTLFNDYNLGCVFDGIFNDIDPLLVTDLQDLKVVLQSILVVDKETYTYSMLVPNDEVFDRVISFTKLFIQILDIGICAYDKLGGMYSLWAKRWITPFLDNYLEVMINPPLP